MRQKARLNGSWPGLRFRSFQANAPQLQTTLITMFTFATE
jgi:hypothetical protein